jgi:transcription initiation factor TFIID subunit 5
LFVYSYLNLVADCFPRESQKFFDAYKDLFTRSHESDLQVFSTLSLPEHVTSNSIAQIYRTNKYRVTLSPQAYYNLLQFLEAKDKEGGTVVLSILQHQCNIRTAERGGAGSSSLSLIGAALGQGLKDDDVLAEDEGIPGHNPGSANTTESSSTVLVKVKLGPLPMDPDLANDVQSELQDQDARNPPGDGQSTLVQEFERHIKREQSDDTPLREDMPLPPYTARDVIMEVQKVRENRDRFEVGTKTGGTGPGLSVVMFTWHNTYDRSVLWNQIPE